MSKPKHTPGPYLANGTYITDTSGYIIADTDTMLINSRWKEKGLSHWADPGGHIVIDEAEAEANAKLLAAAPDLLAALQKCVEALKVISSMGATTPFIEFGEAAIKKATELNP